jgi:ribulose-phosphate 3-epimerase
MIVELSPSLACARQDRLGAEIAELVEAGADSFHLDVMDGHFVPNLAFSTDLVAALRPLSSRPFHVHLMVENPDAYVERMASAGCETLIFHIEACRYPRRLMAQIESAGMRPGISINPSTPIAFLESVRDVPLIQVMTVEPGFAGQNWTTASPSRVRAIRELCGPNVAICVDGHINRRTAPMLRQAGAAIFVCGTSALFRGGSGADVYRPALADLRNSIEIGIEGTA